MGSIMIITISHQKGGVGKSTLAYNIAVELSKKNNVQVIDLDVQQTVSAYNQVRSEMGQHPLPVHIFTTAEELEVFFETLDDEDEFDLSSRHLFFVELCYFFISIIKLRKNY